MNDIVQRVPHAMLRGTVYVPIHEETRMLATSTTPPKLCRSWMEPMGKFGRCLLLGGWARMGSRSDGSARLRLGLLSLWRRVALAIGGPRVIVPPFRGRPPATDSV